MNELIWVTAAEYLGEHKLGLSFNDGSRKVFDFSPLIKKFPLYKGIEPTLLRNIFTKTECQHRQASLTLTNLPI